MVALFPAMMLAALLGVTSAATVTAQAETDAAAKAAALGECFVGKTTGADRITVSRWMLAAMASAPKMADVAKVDPARKTALDQSMAVIFTRLITVDCANEARPLLLTRNSAAFETAGGALGQIAMKELLADPKALAELSAYTKYLDRNAFENVVK